MRGFASTCYLVALPNYSFHRHIRDKSFYYQVCVRVWWCGGGGGERDREGRGEGSNFFSVIY